MSLIYLLMVAILVVRPWGLFGRPLKIKALSEKNLGMEAQEISPVHFSVTPLVRLIPWSCCWSCRWWRVVSTSIS